MQAEGQRIQIQKEDVIPESKVKNFYSCINFTDRSSKDYAISNFCSTTLFTKSQDSDIQSVETDSSK